MRCEDYPCCGHSEQDPCDGTGLTMDDWLVIMSRPGYDDYYDQ